MKKTSLACQGRSTPASSNLAPSGSWLAGCVLAASALFAPVLNADLIQTETLDATLLGNFVMDLSNDNVVINSVSVVGSAGQIATFTNGLSIPGFLDFDSGLVMSSGTAAAIAGPNAADGTSTDIPPVGALDGDAQFDTLTDAPQGTFDAVYIVIDFTPTGDQITGDFVFSSEEYNEYAPPDGADSTNNTFYDVMAFFINDVNYSVTAEGDNVSINSVNKTLNSAEFVDNDFGDFQPAASPFNIEPDGFTETLTWTAPVKTGESNILKFGVADGGDFNFDSWLLVAKNSFRVLNAPSDVDLALNISDGGDEVVATTPLSITALLENVGVNIAQREITVDLVLPNGVAVNNAQAASISETGLNADEWTCVSSDTTPQTISCSSVTPLYNTPGNTQTEFGFVTDPVDASLIGSTLVFDAVVSTSDNDINATNNTAAESALVVVSDTTAPNVIVSGMPALTGSVVTIPVTISFNEDVSPLSVATISVVNGSASNLLVVDAQQVTVDIKPDGFGDISLSLPAGAVVDAAGNSSAAIGPVVAQFDPSSPVLSISNVPGNGIATAPFNVILDFSEAVLDFVLEDILITNGFATTLIALDADSYELTVTPDGSNNLTLAIPDGAAQSVANGTASSAAGFSVVLNESAPFATFSDEPASGAVAGPYTLTITWSEEVNGMELADIIVNNATLSNLSPAVSTGTVYTVDVTPVAQGGVSVSILESAVTDTAGYGSPASLASTTVFDTVAPADPGTPLVLTAASDSGSSSSDQLTALEEVVVYAQAGTALEGEVATLIQQGVAVGTSIVQADGGVSFSVIGLVEENNTLSYTVTDFAGNTSDQSPELLVVLDTFGPEVIIAAIPFVDVSNQAAYPIYGSCSALGGTVTVSVPGAEPASLAISCDISGQWSATFDITLVLDGIGTVAASASHTDIAGNTTLALPVTANKDSSSPTLSIGVIGVDDVLNASESSLDVIISGTTTGIPNAQLVSISLNGQLYSASVSDGAWSTAIPALDVQQFGLSEQLIADVSTPIGLPAPQATRAISVDVEAPFAPVVNPLITNNANPVLTGLAIIGPGGQFSVTVNGIIYNNGEGILSVDAEGFWSLSIPTDDILDEGVIEVIATVVDAAGNSSNDASSQELEIDLSGPTIIINSPISGDNVISLAEAGRILVTGSSEPAGLLNLIIEDNLGQVVQVSITIDVLGNWSSGDLDLAALQDGPLSISATASDSVGNLGSATLAIVQLLQQVPVIVVNPVSIDNVLNTLDLSQDVIIQGTSTSLADADEVSLSANGQQYTASVVSSTWQISVPAIDAQSWIDGEVLAVDSSNEAGTPSETISLTLSIDKILPVVSIDSAPLVTTANFGNYAVSGDCSNGDLSVVVAIEGAEPESQAVSCSAQGDWTALFDVTIVPDGIGTVTILTTQSDLAGNVAAATPVAANKDLSSPSITILAVAGDDRINAVEAISSVLLSGQTLDIEDNQIVSILLDGNNYSAVVTAGMWSVSVPFANIQNLLGDVSIAANATTLAGLAAPEADRVISVDLLAPDAPSIAVLSTASSTPLLMGTANIEAGDELSVTVGNATYTLSAGDVIDLGEGNWTLSIPLVDALVDGAYDVQVVLTDEFGNNTSVPGLAALTIDTAPPSTPLISLDLLASSDSGRSAIDDVTNETRPEFSAPAGSASPGDVVLLYTAADLIGTTTVASDGGFVVASTSDLSNAINTVSYRLQDQLGNTSESSPTLDVVVDTQASPIVLTIPVMGDNTINLVESTVLLLQGSAEQDALLGITITDQLAETVTLQINADALGQWSTVNTLANVSSLSQGDLQIDIVALDVAGNSISSTALIINHDSTLPDAPTVDQLSTNSLTPVLTGVAVLQASETLQVTVAGEQYLLGGDQLSIDPEGLWTLIIPPQDELSEAIFDVLAEVVDAAQNMTGDASTNELIVDTTAPVVSVAKLSNVSSSDESSYSVSGQCEALDAQVIVNVFDAQPAAQSVVCLSDGSWLATVDTNTIADGTNVISVTATQTDVAGNSSTAGPLFTSKETTFPSVSISSIALDDVINAVELTENLILTGATSYIETGQEVTVTVAGVSYTANVEADFWALQIPQSAVALFSPLESITADVAALNGVSAPQATRNVHIDSQLPATPSVMVLLTNQSTPQLNGVAVLGSGDELSVAVNGISYNVAGGHLLVVDDTWVLTLPVDNALFDGMYDVSVSITDTAGNVSNIPGVAALTIDTQLPSTPSLALDLAMSSDSGISDTDNITQVAMPQFSTPAGSVTGGTQVELLADNVIVGTATAMTDGSFVIASSGLSEGNYAISYQAVDGAGNKSSPSPVLNVIIDNTAQVATINSPVMIDDAIGSLEALAATLEGLGEPDAALVIHFEDTDGNFVETNAAVDSLGEWTMAALPVDLSALAAGFLDIAVQSTDLAGNVSLSPSAYVDFYPIPLASPTVESVASNQTTPTIAGSFAMAPGVDLSVQVNGIRYELSNDDISLIGDGLWSLSIPSLDALDEGVYEVVATLTDAGGNTSVDQTLEELNVDLAAPVIPTITPQNSSATDTVLTGQAILEMGEILNITVNGTVYTTDDLVLVIDGSGLWSLSLSGVNALVDGVYEVIATVTDAAGNKSLDNSTTELVVDRLAPGEPIVNPVLSSSMTPVFTGLAILELTESLSITLNGVRYDSAPALTIDSEGLWTLVVPTDGALLEGQYEVLATVMDAAGNATSDSSSLEVTIDTTAPVAPTVQKLNTSDGNPLIGGGVVLESGDTFAISLNGAFYQLTDDALTLDTTTTWRLQVPALSTLVEGVYEVDAVLTDAAGNVSSDTSSAELTVDTTAPSQPQVNLTVTASSVPTVTGTAVLEPGETLIVSVGGNTYALGGDDLFLDGSGNWSLTIPDPDTLLDGEYEVLAWVVDAAGNSIGDNTTLELMVDSVAPSIPKVNVLNTNDSTPLVTGYALVGTNERLLVAVNGIEYELSAPELSIDGAGNWALDLSAISALADGKYAVAVSIVDDAGNTSSVPGSDALTIDTELPQLPSIDVLLTNSDSPLLTGVVQLQPSEVLSVELNGQTYTSDASVAVDNDGNWSLNLPAQNVLTEGVYDVAVTVIDLAGNISSDISIDELEIDRTAPSLTLTAITADDFINIADTQAPLNVVGTSNAENGSVIDLSVASSSYTGTVADGSWQVAVPLVDVQSFGISVTFTAQATDLAGNQSLNESRVVLVDIAEPDLSVDQMLSVFSGNQENVLITGSCESTGSMVSITVPGADPITQDVVCSEGRFSAVVDTSAITDGLNVVHITVMQDDLAGNASNVVPLVLSKDTQLPGLIINGINDGGDGIINVTEAQEFTALGDTVDAQPGDTVTVVISDADASITGTTTVNVDFGWYISGLNISALTDGLLSVEASVMDAAGNESAVVSVDVTHVSTVPSLSAFIDSPVWDSTPLVSGFSNQPDGALVELRTYNSTLLCTAVVSAGAWQCEALNPLADGGYTLIASFSDPLGNQVTHPMETLIDTLLDSDGDGLTDLVEGELDTDMDGLSNNLDTDSDGDGIPDMVELMADPDGDDVPAYIDLDTDGDTLPDVLEGVVDTDLDGLPNYLDIDSDNDGLSDTVEVGELVTNPRDTNADGIADYLEADSDADGLDDMLEGTADTDDDGFADYIDLDSDGDGIPDAVEGNEDSDFDGVADRIDLDSDGDGIGDTVEAGAIPASPVDTDLDSIPDYLDLDSDADGISDTVEGSVDSDADGIPDSIDSDSNGDGIPDVLAGTGDTDGDGIDDYLDGDIDGDSISNTAEGLLDTDGDGIANYRDTDSDGDSIADSLETDADADSDGVPNFLDTDSDGDELPDVLEVGVVPTSPVDTDIDGIPDFLDEDSDGDGIADAIEGALDSDNDSVPSYLDPDSDNDGLADALEGSLDADGDGIGNYQDIDSDNDGLGDALETSSDIDADGLANYLDLDSDGDTIPDSDEGAGDFDADGLANFVDTDSDGDSIDDVVEIRLIADPASPTPLLVASDSDSDGSPDYLDTDSDGDSLADVVEVGPDASNPLDTDSDGLPDYIDLDSDNDGLPDNEESSADSDGDGIPDVLDNDINNDGIPDNIAGIGDADNDGTPNFLDADIDGDGIANTVEGLLDTDGDGLANYLDLDSDADNINDAEEGSLDTDGDLVANFLDTDSDDDGLLDINESSVDFDEDGQPNYIDTDSDNDGLDDSIETDADQDNDTQPNYLDADSDNDGVLDTIEGAVDSDADGLANFIDSDSDNDGISDSDEAGVDPFLPLDSDNDLTADYLDSDSDNDGINDSIETITDTDNDGTPNYLDNDSDGDGIADSDELAMDTDADGLADFIDLDTDGDGITDSTEGTSDADGDGVPSYRDTDADGDGIADAIETEVDTDNDGTPNYLDNDSDADGINDSVEVGSDLLMPRDTDADGQPDYIDLDSDNDGLLDIEEGALDSDGDGVPDLLDQDSNNDGIPDVLVGNEDQDSDGIPDSLDNDIDNDGVPNTVEGVVDTDGDGQFDFRDIDSDADTIPDAQEGSGDTDADGIPNFQDLDSDGDGIADSAESTVDSDGDGIPDYIDTDSDGDGISDALEGVIDTDEDGLPNYLDLMSDFDGIADALEGGADTDGDGVINSADMDADGDGINDDVEAGADTGSPLDTDQDGIPDFLDSDSDNDGISDLIEGVEDSDGDGLIDSLDRDSNNDGISDAAIGGGDTDGDGISNLLDNDIDGDGIDNISEGVGDSDGDGIADFLDTDSDGDGIADVSEGIGDADGDGIVNYLDTDADNDGLSDIDEGAADTDADGTPNFLDSDSDGDGISDAVESTDDLDADGLPDFLDADADGDNISDADEGVLDLDGDGIPNYLDSDSDNDGISDLLEGGSDTDADNTPNFMDTDSDNDGIADSIEGTTDTDEDGLPDFLDQDSDDDGISDLFEGSVDTDADGLADFLDLDADADGIADSVEGQSDFDIDGVPDYKDTDSDNDGIFDVIESAIDTDQDGLPDYLDLDSDGDAIPDAAEGNNDVDNNGVPDFQEISLVLDSDNDGLINTLEGFGDTDGDGVPDYLDSDADDDGIADSVEGAVDTDGDGTFDYRDLDSDGDSLPDISEGIVDTDSDSLPDYIDTDSDGDGINDLVETNADTDGDGLHDALDLDSDADGLSDLLEGAIDSDGDGIYNARDLDSDNDGLSDRLESIRSIVRSNQNAVANSGVLFSDQSDGLLSIAFDNDADSIADYRDLDSDNDSITDTIEANFADADQDGRVDNMIDNNRNGWHDPAERTESMVPDTDADGLLDFRDIDSDQDGLPDIVEVEGVDRGMDGRVDNFVDRNNDGLDDSLLVIPATLSDSDSDSIYNFRELDSDNDGLNDLIEIGGSDIDGDGRVDSLLDSDGDLIPNVVDVDLTGGADADNDGIDDSADADFVSGADTDFDGIVDARDPDSNGDGFADVSPLALGAAIPDTDEDSIPDFQQPLKNGTVKTSLSGNGIGCSIADDGQSQKTDVVLWLMLLLTIVWQLRSRVQLLLSCALMVTLLSSCGMFPRSKQPPIASSSNTANNASQLDLYRDDPPRRRVYMGVGVGASILDPNTEDTEHKVANGGGAAAHVHLGMDFGSRLSGELHAGTLGRAALEPRNPAIGQDADASVNYTAIGASALFYSGADRAAVSRRQGLMGYVRAGLGVLASSGTGVEVEKLNSLQLLIGLGAEYGMRNRLAVRAELLSYDADARALQLALLYRFGKGRSQDNQRKFISQSSASAAAQKFNAELRQERKAIAAQQAKARSNAIALQQEQKKAATTVIQAVQQKSVEPKSTSRAVKQSIKALDSDKDGIVDAKDACVNTESGIPIDDVGCAYFSGVSRDIEFVAGTVQLTNAAKQELDRISEILGQYPRLRVQISTHTDNAVDPVDAQNLTKKQAISVARYLVSTGVNSARLAARAYGSSRPLVPNTSAAAQKRNRRVEILSVPAK